MSAAPMGQPAMLPPRVHAFALFHAHGSPSMRRTWMERRAESVMAQAGRETPSSVMVQR
jgi:hypothetical protein